MTTTAVSPAPASMSGRTVRYALGSIGVNMRRTGFAVFTVVLPLSMYLLFMSLYGRQDPVTSAVLMTNMASYGAFGAALSAGAQLQAERTNGWLRQLNMTGLSSTGFVIAKIITAMALMLPAVVLVFLAGVLLGHVRGPVTTFLAAGGTIWLLLLPMVIMGIVLALWLKPETVQPASTIVMMAFSVLGGLWMPADMLPHWLQQIVTYLPTFWLGMFARMPFTHEPWHWTGFCVQVGWMVGLVVLAALGFRRAVSASRR